MENTIIMENILNPNKALEEYKSYLLTMYVKDYGEKYYDLIKNRMDNTIYLFDANPLENMKFLEENGEDIFPNIKKIRTYLKEYKNFIKIKNALENKYFEDYYLILSNSFSYYSKFGIEDFINIDLDSYSSTNIMLLNDKYTSDSIKKDILKRQQEYMRVCSVYGIEPITNPVFIDSIISKREELIRKKNTLLISKTRWGRRIKSIVNRNTKFKVSDLDIAQIIFNGENCAMTSTFTNKNGDFRLCYVPLTKIYKLKGLDRVFFHENRHVVECSSINSGIDTYDDDKYSMLNEIRTEKNAIRDSNFFKSMPLFSNCDFPSKYDCTYSMAFPYTMNFFEDNCDVLNDLSINNDVVSLESIYGANDLKLFNDYLDSIVYSKINGEDNCDVESIERGKRLVRNLNNNVSRQRVN